MNLLDKKTIEEYYKAVNIDSGLMKTSNDIPTPLVCVEEMTRRIPESIWKNPSLRILDPCCGCGNFFIVIYRYLIEFHSREHILKNMLFFNDTNEDRLAIVRQVFGNDAQITSYDFLEATYTNMFDIIVANPPYAKLLSNGKRASKNHNLISEFLKRSLQVLSPGGFLLYITPDNWMSLSDRNTLIRTLTERQILYLNIHCAKQYFKKVGSSFTWYVIENKSSYKNILVEGIWKGEHYTDSIQSGIRSYIPLYYTSIVHSILSKTIDKENMKFKVETSSDLHKYTKRDIIRSTPDELYCYRLIHTPSQTVWASRPHKYQEGYKVFIGLTSYYKVYVDTCGMTQSIAFIRCKNEREANEVVSVLNHPLYRFINNICRWGNFNNIRILQRFPVCREYKNVYSTFRISNVEKELIDKLDQC